MSKRILVVDDEPNVRLNYRMTLETEGFTVVEANCGSAALDQLSSAVFDLAILDMRMPEMDGLDLLDEMRARGYATPTVIITAYGSIPHAVRALKLGAIDFLKKPMTPESLRNIVNEVTTRHTGIEAAETTKPQGESFGSQLSEAKRLINLQSFEDGWTHLSRALQLSPQSPEALNLAGVFFEMQEDFVRARKLYGKAIHFSPYYEPAQQNMRRIFELFHFGSSTEPMNLGER